MFQVQTWELTHLGVTLLLLVKELTQPYLSFQPVLKADFFPTLLRGRFLSRKFPLQNQEQGKEQGPLKDSLKEIFTFSFSS